MALPLILRSDTDILGHNDISEINCMEHLALEVFDLTGTGSQYAWLPRNASITINDTSGIFGSGDVWSHPFRLNVYENAGIFGSSGDLHGSRLHEQIHKRRARLWVMGLPLFLGYLMLGDEAEVDEDGNVDVTFESGQHTFDEMIEGAKANQVPTIGDVEIGMALWRKRWTHCRVKLEASLRLPSGSPYHGATLSGPVYHTVNGELTDEFELSCDGEEDGNSVQEYPRMVFPRGSFDNTEEGGEGWNKNCINTNLPYTEDEDGTPTNPYCNIALCYQKYGYLQTDKDGNTKPDDSAEPVAQRGYEYMPADRINSAPCFYVAYWVRCLMTHLGIHIEENQMMQVEDLRRLFFVNTNCAYIEPTKLRSEDYNERFGRYKHDVVVNNRLQRPVPEYVDSKKNIDTNESGFHGSNVEMTGIESDVSNVSVNIKEVMSWDLAENYAYGLWNNYYHKAIASSECFPDVDISEVIKAIEDGFGVRFLFSDDYSRVRIILLRNILRSGDVQDIACEIEDESVKVENSIRGFRMTYGDNKDNTEFFYKGFDDKLPKKKPYFVDDSDKHDYSHWDLNAVYSNIINRVSAFDKTCYVTPVTGDAYGVKIDKDAKRYDELHPSLFEFAGYMDAIDGNCTGEDSTVHTVNVGFTPAIMNDLNMTQERGGDYRQRFALFVDATMRPRRVNYNDVNDYDSFSDPTAIYDTAKLYAEGSPARQMMAGDGFVKPGEFAILSDMYAAATDVTALVSGVVGLQPLTARIKFDMSGHINEGYRLYLQDNYEPNDDGVSPIEKKEWGLTLGIMRGSGSDAYIDYQRDPEDGENNDTWDLMAVGSATAHPDTCDNYGNRWDYNGSESGIGNADGRVSLKLRAEKLNPNFDPTLPETHYDQEHPERNTNPRYLTISNPALRQRGLADQFYKEYSYWLRNARVVQQPMRMELAQLLTIDKTKRVRVGDIMGFIRKMQYTISNETGLGKVTMEIMYL